MDKSIRSHHRDFITVARIIKNFVPEKYTEFHSSTNYLLKKVLYTAPEVQGELWKEMSAILTSLSLKIKDLPIQEKQWEKSLVSIFSDIKYEDVAYR